MKDAYVASVSYEYDFQTAITFLQEHGLGVEKININTRQVQGKALPEDLEKFELLNVEGIKIH